MSRSRLVVQPPSVGRFSMANDLQPFPVLGVVYVNRTLPLCTSMKPVAMMRALLLALGVVCATGGPTIAAAAPVRWLPTLKGPQRAERTSKDLGIQGNKYRNSSESWVQKPWVSGLFLVKENQPTRKKTAPEVVGSVNVDITMQAQKMALQNRYGNGSKE